MASAAEGANIGTLRSARQSPIGEVAGFEAWVLDKVMPEGRKGTCNEEGEEDDAGAAREAGGREHA